MESVTTLAIVLAFGACWVGGLALLDRATRRGDTHRRSSRRWD